MPLTELWFCLGFQVCSPERWIVIVFANPIMTNSASSYQIVTLPAFVCGLRWPHDWVLVCEIKGEVYWETFSSLIKKRHTWNSFSAPFCLCVCLCMQSGENVIPSAEAATLRSWGLQGEDEKLKFWGWQNGKSSILMTSQSYWPSLRHLPFFQ